MIELVLAVCMVDQPTRCRNITLTFEGDRVSAQQCMSNGQIEMARWAGEHPNWVIQKWHCGIAGQFAKL
ncbi:hypothetical protein [Hyphomicrobium sp.]|uniref:hypothetical protein n=1 Tax=Hyphomicrobium sp. TaxID=82 RepID=UPI002D7975AF|nr:hypothetical protein [Hyphomicrobium sp.]HET6390640.1 hypothetical protein [Hyphomicrobium sp.]